MGNGHGVPPPGGYGAPPGGYGAPPGGYGAPPKPPYGPPGGHAGTPLPSGQYGYGAPPAHGERTPEPGAFGQPPPYNMAPVSGYAIHIRGSLGLGFLAGFFGGCVGLGLVYALARGPDTKRGAAVGFGGFLALCALAQIIKTFAL